MTLVAAYSFDTGAVVDDSGRGHPGTLFNSPTFPAGHTSLGLKCLASSTQYVEVADHADFTFTSTWTVMCWVKPTSLVVGELVCKRNQWWFSMDTAGKVQHGFYFSGGGNAAGVQSTNAMTAGNWYHWAARFDGTQYDVVFNGVQDTGLTDASGKTMADTTDPVRMGSWDGASEFLDATIDDVRIYNEWLSDAQITSLMNTPVSTGAVRGRTDKIDLLRWL